MSEPKPLRLRIIGADGKRQTLELTGASFIIGSSADAAIRLNDEAVSPLHARLKVRNGQVFVTDLSDTHTHIDGAEVGVDTPLLPGQTLEVGSSMILLQRDDAAKPAATSTEVVPVAGGAATSVDTVKLDPATLEAARLEATRLEAARLEAARLEATRLESARIEAARQEATRAEAAREQAAKAEAAQAAEAARQAADQAAREAREKAATQARLSAEQAERERLERERAAQTEAARSKASASAPAGGTSAHDSAVSTGTAIPLRKTADDKKSRSPAMAPAAVSHGNAALQLRSVLDAPKAKGHKADASLYDYAARFLSRQLPEVLRPTAEDKRLQVALVWADNQFLDVKDIAPGAGLTIGQGQGVGMVVPGLSGQLPFVQATPEGFRVLLPDTAAAVVETDSGTHDGGAVSRLTGAAAVDVPVKGTTYLLGLHDRVSLTFGNLRIIARYTKPQVFAPTSLQDRIDLDFLVTVLILIMTGIAFMIMVSITDFSGGDSGEDLAKAKAQFAKFYKKQEEEKKKEEKKKPEKLSGVKAGDKAKGEEGKFGKQEAKQKEAAPSKKGAPVVDTNKREEDRQKVNQLLAFMGGTGPSAVSNVLGPGGVGTGNNYALGGRNGAAANGDQAGVGGLGLRGGGGGGGGNGLGIGGLGGSGNGRGRGGSGEFDLGGTGKGNTKFVPGKVTVASACSQDEVGRVIRRHWNEIKYCYEKELQKAPDLQGKVGIAFVINPMGDVDGAKVSETTLNNSAAESCMIQNVKRWKFPEPKGGGECDVNYPFIFNPN